MSWLLALFLTCAQAGYLRIIGEPTLAVVPSGDGLKLFGEYQIRNEGDEAARDVFPEINLDQFQWKGEPKILEAGETVTWKIQEKIKKADLALPVIGQIPLSIFHHYADTNGYPFAIPSVHILSSGDKKSASAPLLGLNVSSKGGGQYAGNLRITNSTNGKLKLSPIYLLPREVELRSPVVPLEVAANGELEASYLFQNQKGLAGSSYQTFVVVQWVENGTRQAVQASSLFKIEKQTRSRMGWSPEFLFWGAFIWVVGCGLIGMWVFWIRPLRKMR